MDLDLAYPAVSDLARRARRRIPRFAWEYLDSATGDEASARANRSALDAVRLRPQVMAGHADPVLATELLGTTHALPVGIAPIGMTSVIWPGAETILARLAAEIGVPFALSTVSATTPERIGPIAGGRGWFQLYPPRDPGILSDLLRRAKEAGFGTLVLTADVPVASRRERQTRARLTNPMRVTPRTLAEVALAPAWGIEMTRWMRENGGVPHLKTLEPYVETSGAKSGTAHAGYLIRGAPDWDYFARLREAWKGPLIVKGILDPDAARTAADEGADALWVSNHGGRQFEAAPAAIDVLEPVRAAVGYGVPLLYDSGIRSATDVLRAIAKGADFVMLGRAMQYGLAAFGERGARHVLHIIREGLHADMGQLGIVRPVEARARLMR